ncbi:MAG TPA: alpha/beta hydrolase [Ardenticatenaceae bacterium]|nr:alpha/beta hydrolase [Ardenticatenaceae bacterium]
MWTHREAIVNGIRFHYVEAGEGPLVLLLHGFPEFWYGWRYQIPALAAAGFHVVAPDMRGYNLTEKPPGVQSYHIGHLVADAAELLRAFGGPEGSFLVGNDWGGVISWYTASRHPELVRKLVVLNAPHPNRYLEIVRGSLEQALKSYYVGLFQIPRLPEWLLTLRGGALVERLIRGSGVNPANFTREDGRRFREAIGQPGAATATLNYYRSEARRSLRRGLEEVPVAVTVPTLLLWGRNDVALSAANADAAALRRWIPDLHVELFDASHWLNTDLPEAVNARIITFLRA